jgi:hypothetical protein
MSSKYQELFQSLHSCRNVREFQQKYAQLYRGRHRSLVRDWYKSHPEKPKTDSEERDPSISAVVELTFYDLPMSGTNENYQLVQDK